MRNSVMTAELTREIRRARSRVRLWCCSQSKLAFCARLSPYVRAMDEASAAIIRVSDAMCVAS